MVIFQIPTRYFSPTFRLIFCTKMHCFQTKPYCQYIRGWTFSISAYFVCFDLKNIIILTVFLKNSSFDVEKYQILKTTFFSFHIIKKARHLDVAPTPNATLRCRIFITRPNCDSLVSQSDCIYLFQGKPKLPLLVQSEPVPTAHWEHSTLPAPAGTEHG